MHPYAEFERPVSFHWRLPGQRTLDGVDHAGELCEIAVAHPFDDAAVMLGDGGLDDSDLVRLQQLQRAGLVLAHETRVAHQVCVEHCCEATLHPQFVSARGTLWPEVTPNITTSSLQLTPGGSRRGPIVCKFRYFAPRHDVRFGSKADMCNAKGHVRFPPPQ